MFTQLHPERERKRRELHHSITNQKGEWESSLTCLPVYLLDLTLETSKKEALFSWEKRRNLEVDQVIHVMSWLQIRGHYATASTQKHGMSSLCWIASQAKGHTVSVIMDACFLLGLASRVSSIGTVRNPANCIYLNTTYAVYKHATCETVSEVNSFQ